MDGGMATPGFTSVWNVPRHSPPRSFTAPTPVMAQELAEPPVVSRSTTTKVTSWRGAPNSSNDGCTKPDGKGTCVRRQEHMFAWSAVAPTRPGPEEVVVSRLRATIRSMEMAAPWLSLNGGTRAQSTGTQAAGHRREDQW